MDAPEFLGPPRGRLLLLKTPGGRGPPTSQKPSKKPSPSNTPGTEKKHRKTNRDISLGITEGRAPTDIPISRPSPPGAPRAGSLNSENTVGKKPRFSKALALLKGENPLTFNRALFRPFPPPKTQPLPPLFPLQTRAPPAFGPRPPREQQKNRRKKGGPKKGNFPKKRPPRPPFQGANGGGRGPNSPQKKKKTP
eukprot:FR735693.1.p1 GENE.FR735693.1~~FR735693.1.p1  ORF type:complete len:194 (+),score=93.81 FR735693.1:425-1006(+)